MANTGPEVLAVGAAINRLMAAYYLRKAGAQPHRLWFPKFGALLADRILTGLVSHLKQSSVSIHPHSPLNDIDLRTGGAQIGRRFDHIVVATGWRGRDFFSIREIYDTTLTGTANRETTQWKTQTRA
ncbi:MAG: hypothetical protein JKX76_00240 [Colwellia sp.]|nr:hypothetical protein [Colwellia sp.]